MYQPKFPKSKYMLIEPYEDGQVQPFRSLEWAAGQGAIDFDRWMTAEMPYFIEWQQGMVVRCGTYCVLFACRFRALHRRSQEGSASIRSVVVINKHFFENRLGFWW